jgi:electron transfer flavoprotein beta subunit
MKVIVVFKWARNPQDALVGADGNVTWPGVRMSANDDDPAVMEVAAALAAGEEVTGLTIGDGDTAWAAARGAARTVVVTDALTELDSSQTGAVLAAAIGRLTDVDAVLIGDSSWDYGVVAALTGQLGWAAIAGVTAAEPADGCLRVTRKMGSVSQVLEVKGPAVLAVVANREEQNAPGMKDVLMARKKPVEKLAMADLGLTPSAHAVQSRGYKYPDTPAAHLIDGADPVAACEELMAALHSEGVV